MRETWIFYLKPFYSGFCCLWLSGIYLCNCEPIQISSPVLLQTTVIICCCYCCEQLTLLWNYTSIVLVKWRAAFKLQTVKWGLTMAYKSLIPFYICKFKLKFEGGLLLNNIYIYSSFYSSMLHIINQFTLHIYLYEVLCY